MCGRLTQQLSSDEIARLFGATDPIGDLGGHFNVAPTQSIRGVMANGDQRVVAAYRWGLIPPWSASPKDGPPLFNARSETVAEKPAFRTAFRRTRCILPADAFYEWRREGTAKTPYAIRRKDGQPLAFAGLWSSWRDRQTNETVPSCTIITTTANGLMAPLHDRMPVILDAAAWDEWLDPENEDLVALHSLLVPCPDDALKAYPVSRLVNDVRHDGPELLEPIDGAA